MAGADGCPGGWVVALRRVGAAAMRVRVVPSAAALMALPEHPAVLGVDVPIGVPEAAARGGRACDRAARQALGHPRSSSVFSPPVRAALDAQCYEDALAANRRSSPAEIGLSIQAYHLIGKIRALDQALTPVRQAFVREVHPELSFAAMDDGHGVAESKKTREGRTRRRALLDEAGFAPLAFRLPGAAPDDVLDACAACWTAARIIRDEARRYPERPTPTDVRGLRMEIWQ